MSKENTNTKIPILHVKYSFYAYMITIIVSLLDFLLQYAGISTQTSEFTSILNFIIGAIIYLLIFWFIFKNKNWARILYLVLIILSVPFAIHVITVEFNTDLLSAISSSIQVIFSVISLYFLFTKQSNNWFKTRKNVIN